MLREHSLFAIGFAILGSVLPGCGSPPAAEGPPAEPAAKAEAGPSEGAASSEKPPSIEDQRDAFMKSCSQQSQSKDFCTCAFEQFKEAFKDADLSKPPEEGRLQEMRKKTAAACSSKLTEEDAKNAFNRDCVAGDERKAAYCGCAWTSLRKKLAFTDFMGEVDEAKIEGPKKVMVVECKGKFPTEIAKLDFMNACKSDGTTDKVCSCRWDKIKKQFSTEEIVAGTADIEKVKGLETCK